MQTKDKLDQYDWIGVFGRLDKIENIVGDPVYMMG